MSNKQITFSSTLVTSIRRTIEAHIQELGEDIEGVEELVGDFTTDDAYVEWQALIDQYGFDKVTQAVKNQFI